MRSHWRLWAGCGVESRVPAFLTCDVSLPVSLSWPVATARAPWLFCFNLFRLRFLSVVEQPEGEGTRCAHIKRRRDQWRDGEWLWRTRKNGCRGTNSTRRRRRGAFMRRGIERQKGSRSGVDRGIRSSDTPLACAQSVILVSFKRHPTQRSVRRYAGKGNLTCLCAPFSRSLNIHFCRTSPLLIALSIASY